MLKEDSDPQILPTKADFEANNESKYVYVVIDLPDYLIDLSKKGVTTIFYLAASQKIVERLALVIIVMTKCTSHLCLRLSE